jgi:lysophospholipase L1-like esterase
MAAYRLGEDKYGDPMIRRPGTGTKVFRRLPAWTCLLIVGLTASVAVAASPAAAGAANPIPRRDYVEALNVLATGTTLAPVVATPRPDLGDDSTDAGPWYLAVGASESVGFQPTAEAPGGQLTDHGYANDVAAAERSVWPGLKLAQVGCPGATTGQVLHGGACPYAAGSQLAAAVDFLHRHPSTVLVTVDIGFDDLLTCMTGPQLPVALQRIDEGCRARITKAIDQQLEQILTTLQAAGRPGLQIIGLGHYDPWLGVYVQGGAAAHSFAEQSVRVVKALDSATRVTYRRVGVREADVGTEFEIDRKQPDRSDRMLPASLAGKHPAPTNVVRVCQLTWMCAPAPYGPNLHPNVNGYMTIARAIARALVPPPAPKRSTG